MQELIGKLTALDPEASEALKVVSYFDALVTRGVGLDGLLRGAAALSGASSGAERNGKISRFDAKGRRITDDNLPRRFPIRSTESGSVWLERGDTPHANDEMIIDRLALAVELVEARRNPASRLEVVIDSARSLDERCTALATLRLEPSSKIRIVATGPDSAQAGATAVVMPTRYGMLKATLDVSGSFDPIGRTGLGQWVRADHASDSWDSAIVAYRLTNSTFPIIDATEFGAMAILARAYDPSSPHEDVQVLARLDPRSGETLRALVDSDSIRSAASKLGMHHSTLQARHESLTLELGYDPRTTAGRLRYMSAELLRRLSDPE